MNVAAWVRGVLYRPLQGAWLCLKGQLSGTNPISFPQTPIGLLSPLEAVCISRCGLRAGPSLDRLCAKHDGGTGVNEMGPALEGALVSEETGPQRAPHSTVSARLFLFSRHPEPASSSKSSLSPYAKRTLFSLHSESTG